eukprot:gene2153-6470_t
MQPERADTVTDKERGVVPRLPAAALRNDNIFGLIPDVIFKLDVTPAEHALSWPYKDGIIHFDVESVQVHVSMLDPKAKKSFRGNSVYYPLPMEALAAWLQTEYVGETE